MKRNLALFDFDGTLTVADSFTAFIFSAVSPRRLALGQVLLAPLVVAYKLGILSASRMRSSIIWFGFRGRRDVDLRKAGGEFARNTLASILRAEAIDRLQWHQEQGDVVVVVSASLDLYLSEWCQTRGVELICSQLDSREGILTGSYKARDCCGEEKANRILERYDLHQFQDVFAYGDTADDRAMLRLATRRFFRGAEIV